MARTVRAALAAALCLSFLALATSAAASIKCAPPGVSGVSQYVETLPGISCNLASPRPGHGGASHRHGRPGPGQPASGNGGSGATPGGSGQTPGGSGQTSGGALPPGTSRQLSQRGAAGQAVRQLVAQTGTAPGHRQDSASAAAAAATLTGSGRGALGGLIHPLLTGSSRGGAGELLPLSLAAALLVVLAISILRRRRRATQ